jgi:hypothetical protein
VTAVRLANGVPTPRIYANDGNDRRTRGNMNQVVELGSQMGLSRLYPAAFAFAWATQGTARGPTKKERSRLNPLSGPCYIDNGTANSINQQTEVKIWINTCR